MATISVPESALPGDVAALVLAAGRSRRFGRDKREVVLADGERLLDRALRRVREAGVTPFLVLREDDTLRVPAGVSVLRAARAEEGMGASLADAAARLQGRGHWCGCLVVLADMPWLLAETIRSIACALTPDTIVVPEYCGERGHPVGFGRRFYTDLAQLTGDRGARALLERYPQALHRLAVTDPGVLRDVDRVSDLLVDPPPP